jgi:hypothetical protein
LRQPFEAVGSDYNWYVLTVCLFMNGKMDGALIKWAVGIFTEGKGEGPVTTCTTKTIGHADGTTKIVSVYVF